MSKDNRGNKGQIFTLDILLAVLGITVMLGIVVGYQSMVKNQGAQTRYTEMKILAHDASQITVKRLADKENHPNQIDLSSEIEGDLDSLMINLTQGKYNYEVQGAIELNTGACSESEQSANSRRIVIDSTGQVKDLSIHICSLD